MVIQSTSPYFAPRSFWSVDATLKEAGLHTWPYHAYVPSFGDWGFILAGKRRDYTPADKITVPARYRTRPRCASCSTSRRHARAGHAAEPPERTVLVRYFDEDWRKVIR